MPVPGGFLLLSWSFLTGRGRDDLQLDRDVGPYRLARDLIYLRAQNGIQMGVAEMAHSRRVALVLDCGHLTQPAGRVDETAPLVGGYTWCPACEAFQEVVRVGRHLHAVPTESGSGVPAATSAAGRSQSPAAAQLRLVPTPQRSTACH